MLKIELKIEEYLLKGKELSADDEYISDGVIIVSRKIIKDSLFRFKKCENCDYNLMKRAKIPYEKGDKWELPGYVHLLPNHNLEFIFDDNFSFDYKLVSLFINHPFVYYSNPEFFISTFGDEKHPLLKIFNGDLFMGAIAPMNRRYR